MSVAGVLTLQTRFSLRFGVGLCHANVVPEVRDPKRKDVRPIAHMPVDFPTLGSREAVSVGNL